MIPGGETLRLTQVDDEVFFPRRVEMPPPRDTLQLVLATVLEAKARPDAHVSLSDSDTGPVAMLLSRTLLIQVARYAFAKR